MANLTRTYEEKHTLELPKDIFMKYAGSKTHGTDALYVRRREGDGLKPIVKVKIEERVIDKKEIKKYRMC